jgi:hypothetical protein
MTDERFKQLAACVSAEDWDKLVNFTAERILRRLAGAGLLDQADPELLRQAHELVGTALVDFANVALTCVAEGEAKQA